MKIIIAILTIAIIIQTFRVIMLKRDIEHLKIRIRVMGWVKDNPPVTEKPKQS